VCAFSRRTPQHGSLTNASVIAWIPSSSGPASQADSDADAPPHRSPVNLKVLCAAYSQNPREKPAEWRGVGDTMGVCFTPGKSSHLQVGFPHRFPSIGFDEGAKVENALSSIERPAHSAALQSRRNDILGSGLDGATSDR